MSHHRPLTLSVIIVSYNTQELTYQAVNSVIDDLSSNSGLAEKSEIIVVDNNSRDETVTILKQLKKAKPEFNIKLIQNDSNEGFAKANNRGILKSKGKLILLLNSDAVVHRGTLQQLIQSFVTHPLEPTTAHLSSAKDKLDHLGILAATLINFDDSLQPQGGSLPSLISLFSMMFFLDDLPLIGAIFPTIQETGRAARHRQFLKHQLSKKLIQKGWVAGTAMMIRSEVIDNIGVLDPNIFMYGEDIEYCLRAKHHHWDIAIDPQATVKHLGCASSSSEGAILGEIKAYLYIWAKHKPHWQRRFAKMILFLGLNFRRFLYQVIKQPFKAKTYKKALDLIN